MKRNVQLLQQTLQHIKDNPEQHDQSIFFGRNKCNTYACFAGHGALLAGWSERQIIETDMYLGGANLFGLTRREAHIMFDFDNTLPMLELMVKDLVNGDELLSCREDYEELAAQRV